MNLAAYHCDVSHLRTSPKRYSFKNRFFWLFLDLDKLELLASSSRFFSYNSHNLFSFWDKDHFFGSPSLREAVVDFLREHNITREVDKIELLTFPRVLGHVFNPVSFYFCHIDDETYCLIEIGNTFGEVRPYFAGKMTDGKVCFQTVKNFYISPFSSPLNQLNFKINYPQDHFSIHIDILDQENNILGNASCSGRRDILAPHKITTLLRRYFHICYAVPLLIHWHALKLYLKKIPFWTKKASTEFEIGARTWKS